MPNPPCPTHCCPAHAKLCPIRMHGLILGSIHSEHSSPSIPPPQKEFKKGNQIRNGSEALKTHSPMVLPGHCRICGGIVLQVVLGNDPLAVWACDPSFNGANPRCASSSLEQQLGDVLPARHKGHLRVGEAHIGNNYVSHHSTFPVLHDRSAPGKRSPLSALFPFGMVYGLWSGLWSWNFKTW